MREFSGHHWILRLGFKHEEAYESCISAGKAALGLVWILKTVDRVCPVPNFVYSNPSEFQTRHFSPLSLLCLFKAVRVGQSRFCKKRVHRACPRSFLDRVM